MRARTALATAFVVPVLLCVAGYALCVVAYGLIEEQLEGKR